MVPVRTRDNMRDHLPVLDWPHNGEIEFAFFTRAGFQVDLSQEHSIDFGGAFDGQQPTELSGLSRRHLDDPDARTTVTENARNEDAAVGQRPFVSAGPIAAAHHRVQVSLDRLVGVSVDRRSRDPVAVLQSELDRFFVRVPVNDQRHEVGVIDDPTDLADCEFLAHKLRNFDRGRAFGVCCHRGLGAVYQRGPAVVCITCYVLIAADDEDTAKKTPDALPKIEFLERGLKVVDGSGQPVKDATVKPYAMGMQTGT